MIDNRILTIPSLDPADARVFDVRVAGPAALLVAKLHKLGERLGTKRMEDKDALDVLRLLRGTETEWMAARLIELLADEVAGPTTDVAMGHLDAVFVQRGAVGSEMAARAAAHAEPWAVIRASTEVLSRELLAEVRRRRVGSAGS